MKIKSILFSSVLAVSAVYAAPVYAEETEQAQEPQLLYFYDTELGTQSYELLITYSNGGHATIGQALKDAGVASVAPGIGFGVGSGGNGYRPNVAIYIWTDETLDLNAARAAIKSFVNVPSNPETTNGDCAISCDGTYQPEEPAQTTTTTVPQTTTTVSQPEPQPVSEPEPQPISEPEPQPVVTTTTTTTTLPVAEKLNSDSTPTPFYITSYPVVTSKVVPSTKPVTKKKIVKKKVFSKVKSATK